MRRLVDPRRLPAQVLLLLVLLGQLVLLLLRLWRHLEFLLGRIMVSLASVAGIVVDALVGGCPDDAGLVVLLELHLRQDAKLLAPAATRLPNGPEIGVARVSGALVGELASLRAQQVRGVARNQRLEVGERGADDADVGFDRRPDCSAVIVP